VENGKTTGGRKGLRGLGWQGGKTPIGDRRRNKNENRSRGGIRTKKKVTWNSEGKATKRRGKGSGGLKSNAKRIFLTKPGGGPGTGRGQWYGELGLAGTVAIAGSGGGFGVGLVMESSWGKCGFLENIEGTKKRKTDERGTGAGRGGCADASGLVSKLVLPYGKLRSTAKVQGKLTIRETGVLKSDMFGFSVRLKSELRNSWGARGREGLLAPRWFTVKRREG